MGTDTQIIAESESEAAPPWNTQPPSKGKAVTVFDPFHPSVLFEKLKRGWLKGWSGSWTRILGRKESKPAVAKHSRIVGKEGGRRLLESGLVLPSQKDVFLLSRPDDAAEYIRLERRKLRQASESLASSGQ